MQSPEELILAGKLPDGTSANEVVRQVVNPRTEEPVAEVNEIDLSKDSDGYEVFSDINEQVAYDWKHRATDVVKRKKNQSADYAEALLRYLDPESSHTVVDETPVVPEIPAVTTPVAPVVVAPADEEDSGDPNLSKTKTGWEYRVDLEDGSGVQVFKGKTQKEVIAALGKAQINATKKIRQQEREKRDAIAAEPADVDTENSLKPRALTTDEQWELTQNLAGGDVTKTAAALDKYLEIRLGGTLEQVASKLSKHDLDLEYRRASNEAKSFISDTPEFYNTSANGVALANYVTEQGWSATKRNLGKAFVALSALSVEEGGFPDQRPEQVLTPESEGVSTISSPAAALIADLASASAPLVVPPTPVVPPPAALPEGTRTRPGSISTGMSPRQSSVRAGGAAPAVPVGLTVEEYHKVSASEVRSKYRNDPKFKAGVDKLIAEGKI